MNRPAQTCRCPRRPRGARTLVYHGAHRWEGPPEVRPQTQKNTAHGPGIYGTTARSTAARYAKGGGTVLLLDLKDPIRWLDEAWLPRGETEAFVRELPRLKGRAGILADLQRIRWANQPDYMVPAELLVNLFVNSGTSGGPTGVALARFLASHGVHAARQTTYDEDWVVVFDPSVIRSVTPMGPKAPWDLPRIPRAR